MTKTRESVNKKQKVVTAKNVRINELYLPLMYGKAPEIGFRCGACEKHNDHIFSRGEPIECEFCGTLNVFPQS